MGNFADFPLPLFKGCANVFLVVEAMLGVYIGTGHLVSAVGFVSPGSRAVSPFSSSSLWDSSVSLWQMLLIMDLSGCWMCCPVSYSG